MTCFISTHQHTLRSLPFSPAAMFSSEEVWFLEDDTPSHTSLFFMVRIWDLGMDNRSLADGYHFTMLGRSGELGVGTVGCFFHFTYFLFVFILFSQWYIISRRIILTVITGGGWAHGWMSLTNGMTWLKGFKEDVRSKLATSFFCLYNNQVHTQISDGSSCL